MDGRNDQARSPETAQHTPSQMYLADALTGMSWDQAWLGGSAEALSSCEQALEIYSGIGHPEGNAYASHVPGSFIRSWVTTRKPFAATSVP